MFLRSFSDQWPSIFARIFRNDIVNRTPNAQDAVIAILRMQRRRSTLGAMFNLALLLQRGSRHKEAAECWRQYLANDARSEWAARARRSLKFCEMQIHLSAS
jgi:hypothetical protein